MIDFLQLQIGRNEKNTYKTFQKAAKVIFNYFLNPGYNWSKLMVKTLFALPLRMIIDEGLGSLCLEGFLQ